MHIQAKINLKRRDIQMLNECGMAQLIPTIVEELTGKYEQLRMHFVDLHMHVTRISKAIL